MTMETTTATIEPLSPLHSHPFVCVPNRKCRPVKLLRWIVLPPVVILVMAIAIANRKPVTFSLDPFDPTSPAIGLEMPLFLIILASVLIGILFGGLGAWAQARRKAAKPKGSATMGETLPALRD